ncbi:Zn-dependent exopeptidase [Xylaria sp. CBS 124048]|nr:Zn-dependent exopeptidase [Xylaria sp. CBS 124048]
MRFAWAAILLSGNLVACRSWFPTSASSLPSPLESDKPAYRDRLVTLHQSLVEIHSISGTEGSVGDFLVEYLTEKNFVVERQYLPSSNTSDNETGSSSRFNVLAWPGAVRPAEPKVLVSSHIDVVPPHIPYSRSGGKHLSSDTIIAGRGSVDAKASVAAQITAVLELLSDERIDPADVMLLFVVGEETIGDGMKHFSDVAASSNPPLRFKAAVFGEPTEGKLACGHKGMLGCTITAHGKAGHSGYPELGKSAVEVLMRGLVKLLDTDVGSSELFGNTTINVGEIKGGVARNVIPETAVAGLAGRVAMGPEIGGSEIVVQRVKDVMRSVDEEAFEFDCIAGYGTVECDCDIKGLDTITVNYGTDVPNLKGDHTRYLYGPGSILVAHGANEAIKLGDLEAAVEGFQKIILHALGDQTGEL